MSDLAPHFETAIAKAAIACLPWIGRGDKDAADQAAVEAMRTALQTAPMMGRIVIGEGERDEAPMLHIGEQLGSGGPEIDIAVDPLEGTNLCAENQPGAICVLAYAPKGDLLHAPDIYMDKMAAGPGLRLHGDDLDRPLGEVIDRLGKDRPHPLRVIILDRPRHAALITAARASRADVTLIPDGDVMASLQTSMSIDAATPIADLYVGTGGAPEGVLAAAGLQHLGGAFLGRLRATTAAEQARADALSLGDLSKVYTASDLAAASATLVMGGVTGHVLRGVSKNRVDILRISSQGCLRKNKTLA